MSGIVALLVATTLVVAVGRTAGAADRAFGIRFQANDTGGVTVAANTLMTCPGSNPACPSAQDGTATGAAANNNSYVMTYVDVDSDPATFDSSTAQLSLPGGASVLFAGLYWGGDTSAGAGGGSGAPDPAALGTVQFAVPSGSYSTVTASQVDTSTAIPSRYQGIADVTSQVQAAGSGTYEVGNVQAGTGNDRYAGWALVVVYHDPTLPARNLTVFDGFQTVSPSTTADIPVSGFLTPTSGPVRTTLGFVTYEGDLGLLGDSASLNSTVLSDAQHPATNFFDSAISDNGARVTTKNPDYVNQLGFDADLVNADGILASGATTANIHLTTNSDRYFPAVVSFATDLFAPSVLPSKSAVDLNGAPLQQGDVIRYDITGTNTGLDGATNLTVTDPIPAGTSFVPGSLNVVSSPGGIAGPKTDAPGDDQAEVSGSNVVFRLGTGAGASSGGTLEPAESFEVRFRVRVNASTPAGTTIDNRATASMDAETTPGLHLVQESDPVDMIVVAATALHLSKAAIPTSVTAGDDVTFTIVLRVTGGSAATGVLVCDSLPPHMTFVSAPGATFQSGQACWSFASLAAGAKRTFTIVARVDADAPTGRERNVATATADNAFTVRAGATVRVNARAPGSPIGVTG